mmetsp:Transcript_28954/g.83028  ORF Transcript_28954/g.83028 Transcript_28954/m.83028 type:complete len:323 (+) Transcript_28954:56-1024(+)
MAPLSSAPGSVWRLLAGASATLATGAVAAVPSVQLAGGGRMPMVGLGLCCRPSATGDAVRQSVLDFLLLGGRHLDGAQLYGNHREVGEGIRQAVAQGVPREEVFLTTKISPDLFGFEKATAWVPRMLGELGLDYVDLVLLHWAGDADPVCISPKQCRQETWVALQRFVHSGKIRNLGVSNFGPRQMKEIMALGGVPISANQFEFHPFSEAVHRDTVAFCHQHGIAVTAYGSMGSSGGAQQVTTQGAFQQLGQQFGKTAGQVLLRWAVQQNVTVIPGTGNPKHMRENLDIFDFELPQDAMAWMSSLWQGQTMNFFGHTPDAII